MQSDWFRANRALKDLVEADPQLVNDLIEALDLSTLYLEGIEYNDNVPPSILEQDMEDDRQQLNRWRLATALLMAVRTNRWLGENDEA